MSSRQNASINLNKVSFEPWGKKCTEHLSEGTFLFYISVAPSSSNPESIDIDNVQFSFTDSLGTTWDCSSVESIETEPCWRGVASFYMVDLDDSPDMLVENSNLYVRITGKHTKVKTQFRIFHNGPMGNLIWEKVLS